MPSASAPGSTPGKKTNSSINAQTGEGIARCTSSSPRVNTSTAAPSQRRARPWLPAPVSAPGMAKLRAAGNARNSPPTAAKPVASTDIASVWPDSFSSTVSCGSVSESGNTSSISPASSVSVFGAHSLLIVGSMYQNDSTVSAPAAISDPLMKRSPWGAPAWPRRGSSARPSMGVASLVVQVTIRPIRWRNTLLHRSVSAHSAKSA